MHIWIVLAALAFAAATPFLGVPSRDDAAQIMDETGTPDEAAKEADDDEHSD